MWTHVNRCGRRGIIPLIVVMAAIFVAWLLYTAIHAGYSPTLDDAAAATPKSDFCSPAVPSLDPSFLLLGCDRRSPTRFYITSLETVGIKWNLQCDSRPPVSSSTAVNLVKGLSSTRIPEARAAIQGAKQCDLLLTIPLLRSGKAPHLLVEFFGTNGQPVKGAARAHG